MAEKEQTQSYQFQAEIKQLLNILVHSLYQDREIFLRELISNASDALTQLHFEMLTEHDVADPNLELAIYLESREEGGQKWLVVRDTGIGMTAEELVQNLGTIAQSGARAFLQRAQENEASAADIIGQFGVGFYSVFMVAEKVRVVSRSYRPGAEAAAWTSEGDDKFLVEPAEKELRGTEIHILLKEEAEEFASEWRLRENVKKHSDFVSYPIYLDEEQINEQKPLWRISPSEVEEEAYHSFYQQMTLDFQEPLRIIHFHSDAPIHVRALLYIPSTRDRGVLAARKEPGLKLYSHNVMIQEYNTDLLPNWLAFVDGVVDSEDLPLNVSRETVQSNRFMRGLSKSLRRRVVRELEEMAQREPEKYAQFWQEHSRTMKEGLATDPTAVSDLMPLLRYRSSHEEEGLTSLAAYRERMPDWQDAIYFVMGDSLEAARHSPHLDPFQARNIEVLYWVDPLDPFLAPLLDSYEEIPLKNVDDPGIELPELDEDETPEVEADGLEEPALNRFIGRCVTVLGERVSEVRASRVLRRSPVRLVNPADAPNREMQRIYRFLDQDYEVPQRILEVNPNHPLVKDLAHLITDQPGAPLVDLAIEQLYASALVQEGLHPNPSEMLPRIQQLMEIAAASGLGGKPEDEEE